MCIDPDEALGIARQARDCRPRERRERHDLVCGNGTAVLQQQPSARDLRRLCARPQRDPAVCEQAAQRARSGAAEDCQRVLLGRHDDELAADHAHVREVRCSQQRELIQRQCPRVPRRAHEAHTLVLAPLQSLEERAIGANVGRATEVQSTREPLDRPRADSDEHGVVRQRRSARQLDRAALRVHGRERVGVHMGAVVRGDLGEVEVQHVDHAERRCDRERAVDEIARRGDDVDVDSHLDVCMQSDQRLEPRNPSTADHDALRRSRHGRHAKPRNPSRQPRKAARRPRETT